MLSAFLLQLVLVFVFQQHFCHSTIVGFPVFSVPSKKALLRCRNEMKNDNCGSTESTSTDSMDKVGILENVKLFFHYATAGAISCSATHSFMVPLDVVKTKMQVDSTLSAMNIYEAFRRIVGKEGYGTLLQGLAATSSGYFLQGACKFGFYELFKYNIFQSLHSRNISPVGIVFPIRIASAGMAEIVACWALCPLEVTKIAMMMSPELPKQGMLRMMSNIVRREGPSGLFRGLPLVMLRQVPYTCIKLSGYEFFSDTIKTLCQKARHRASKSSRVRAHSFEETVSLGRGGDDQSSNEIGSDSIYVQLMSGVLAGVSAAVISQPFDVLLSKMCGGTNQGLKDCLVIEGWGSITQAMRSIGFKGCFAGLKARAIMVGSLTCTQFLIYERMKELLKERGSNPAESAEEKKSLRARVKRCH